jgi:hypothetical protein
VELTFFGLRRKTVSIINKRSMQQGGGVVHEMGKTGRTLRVRAVEEEIK